jgi:hypothetical protein
MDVIKWGQWVGKISGQNSGLLIMNLDRDNFNTGMIHFWEIDSRLSSYNGKVTFSKSSGKIVGKVENIIAVNSPDDDRSADPKKLEFFVSSYDENKITGEWFADNEQNGDFFLESREITKSSVSSQSVKWNDFITLALTEKRQNKSLIFRGQSDSTWPLRTSFHRTGRRDLVRFSSVDMHELNSYLTLSSNRHYNLDDPIEFAGLIALAQHHGYPTPLLDWSESPLVAAFFAFRSVEKSSDSGSVRIFAFDHEKWEKEGQKYRTKSIEDPRYSITTLKSFASGNSRVLPQQSLFTFTNLVDMERWITTHEINKGAGYFIKAYDIDKTEINDALKDLDSMNINAATLFPGLDGSFEALKMRLFKV